MLTLFSLPKAYIDNIAMIQRNALTSWTLLDPRPEIILLGNDAGVKDVAQEFGVRYEPEIERNEYDTPIVSSVFERGQALASKDVVMYVNADIILLDDFMPAVSDLLQRFWDCPDFLGIGERWDIDIDGELDFSEGWQEWLRNTVNENGEQHGPTGVDYFLFKRGMYKKVPPFAIGRWAWDNWLVTEALCQGVPVINMTKCVLAVHQNHGYDHKTRLEIGQNKAMMGNVPTMHVSHATHTL